MHTKIAGDEQPKHKINILVLLFNKAIGNFALMVYYTRPFSSAAPQASGSVFSVKLYKLILLCLEGQSDAVRS